MFPENYLFQKCLQVNPQQKQWNFFAATCPQRPLNEISYLPSELERRPFEIDENDAIRRDISPLGSSPLIFEEERPNINFPLKEQQCVFIDFSQTQPNFLNSTLPKIGQDFIYMNPKMSELHAVPLNEDISTNSEETDYAEDAIVSEIQPTILYDDDADDNISDNSLNFPELRLVGEDTPPDPSLLLKIRFYLGCNPEEQSQAQDNEQNQMEESNLLTSQFQKLSLSDAKRRLIRNSITQPQFYNPSIKLPLQDTRIMSPLSSPPAIDRSFEFLPDVSCRHINTNHSQPNFYNPKL